MSEAKKGRVVSEESKKKMSEAAKRRKLTKTIKENENADELSSE